MMEERTLKWLLTVCGGACDSNNSEVNDDFRGHKTDKMKTCAAFPRLRYRLQMQNKSQPLSQKPMQTIPDSKPT